MSAASRVTPGALPRQLESDSRLERLRSAPAAELRCMQPATNVEQLVSEWKLLVTLRLRALESAALAQLRRSQPALERGTDLDGAVELAIGASNFTWHRAPFSSGALAPLRRQLRCSFQQLRESLDRLTRAGRVKQEQISESNGNVSFVWKRGAP